MKVRPSVRATSEFGKKQTCKLHSRMSAFGVRTDIAFGGRNVRFWPLVDSNRPSNGVFMSSRATQRSTSGSEYRAASSG
jgi:hypothetical protein